MSFEEFQDGSHLGCLNGTILAILNLCHCDGSIQLSVWEEMSFEEFQDGCHGGHLGYPNGTILAILNLYVTPMPPMFWLNLTYGFEGDIA